MDTRVPDPNSHQGMAQDLMRLNLVRLRELSEGFIAYKDFDDLDLTTAWTLVCSQPGGSWRMRTYAVLFGEVMSESQVRVIVRLHDSDRWTPKAFEYSLERFVRLFVTEPGAHQMIMTRGPNGEAKFVPGW